MTNVTADLLDAIGALSPQRFAVVDGAHFDDLPGALAAAAFVSRPLYLQGIDASVAASGPHLVQVDGYNQARGLLELIGDRPAAVFWSWPAGMDRLYHHLRTLNIVQIARVHAPAGPQDYQTVLFRHADPNVVGVLFEMMDEGQRRDFLGHSPAITFHAPKFGAVRTARAPRHAEVQ